jgi:Ni,Fe-hydrogenase III large subunit/Ni,Fe-hydrogenase III component G
MAARRWLAKAEALAGAPGATRLAVSRDEWSQAVRDLAASGARLASMWAEPGAHDSSAVQAAFFADAGILVLSLDVPSDAVYPGLEEVFPAASRMQRAVWDMSGLRATDPDRRPWLRHAAWADDFHPLRDRDPPVPSVAAADDYAFVRVAGDGVHEIPVGPVHAGIIEPGHFRFSVVGEKVLRLEQRLGYVHKGIERLFTQRTLHEGHRLAARVSGDSAVAFSWAYCQACEGVAGLVLPERPVWLRALALELERIANHLGDLGALGNDAGFAFGLAQFSRLKERLLRAVESALGQRYLLDFIVPGGTRTDLTGDGARMIRAGLSDLEPEVRRLREIYDEHAGLRDRFTGAGIVTAELARRLGVTGLAGRASGQPFDLRVHLPCRPYGRLSPRIAGSQDGDVAARVRVRFDELLESCRLVRAMLDGVPDGPHVVPLADAVQGHRALGAVEGWRGPVLVALVAGPDGSIRRCHPHDPSWLNWPALEHAVIGNIVPDFPLINKSFNLSYSGQDL